MPNPDTNVSRRRLLAALAISTAGLLSLAGRARMAIQKQRIPRSEAARLGQGAPKIQRAALERPGIRITPFG